MPFTVTVTAFQFAPSNDPWTTAKFNQGFNPAITVTGASTDLSDIAAAGAEGQMLIFRAATGKWTPEAIPASSSDTFNRVFAWEHYL